MNWRREGDVRWLEAELPGAKVCFSTRVGGVSAAPFESLNLGILTGDERSAVLENRRRLASALGIEPADVAMGRQVHGSRIATHGPGPGTGAFAEPVPDPEEVDGHVTSEPGLPMLVLVADCLPVAVSGPGGLAMLHCGWRGLAGSLVEDAVRQVRGESAVIGPGIGPCCFEVGDEVLDAFSDLGAGIADGRMCDLTEVARRKLESAGVHHVEASGLCSSCEPELFFSHRRDAGSTGRQAGIAWLTG
jgi:YfiH family protein